MGVRMLSRRIVVHGLAAVSAGLAWRPGWALSSVASPSVPTPISPDMEGLANLWEAHGWQYDQTAHRRLVDEVNKGLPVDMESAAYKRWRKVEERFMHATTVVLSEPAMSEGDVIFKYHVIDMHHSWRPVDNWTWAHANGWELCEGVGREAERFGVAINPFWYKMPSPFAMIDGDQHSPRWAVISHWRMHGMPPSILEAYERAHAERDRTNMEAAVAHRNT